MDLSADGSTCIESVVETQDRLSQISFGEQPLHALPQTAPIPEPSIDGEEEWYDCEPWQGSCNGETPEQGGREMVTPVKEVSPGTQESDKELTAAKPPLGGKLFISLFQCTLAVCMHSRGNAMPLCL